MGEWTNVPVKNNTKDSLDEFRQSDRGEVSYDSAIRTLLDHWQETH